MIISIVGRRAWQLCNQEGSSIFGNINTTMYRLTYCTLSKHSVYVWNSYYLHSPLNALIWQHSLCLCILLWHILSIIILGFFGSFLATHLSPCHRATECAGTLATSNKHCKQQLQPSVSCHPALPKALTMESSPESITIHGTSNSFKSEDLTTLVLRKSG